MTLSSAEPKKHRNRLSEAFHYLSKIYPPRHSSNKSVVSPGKSKNSRCSFSCNSDDNDTGESDPSRSTCSNNGQTTAPHCREGQNQKHERHRDDHHSDGKPKVRLPLWTPPECDMCQSGENERPTVIRMEEGAELFSQPYLGVKDQEENGPNDGLNDGLHNMNNRVTVSVETPEGRVFDDIAGASTASPTSSEKLSHAYQELVDALAANADPFVPSSPDIHDPCSPPDLANPVEQLPMPCRRASNQSVLSEKSTSTVQRYPSRHCSPPLMNNIDSILQNFDFQNSGDDNKDKEPSDEKPESEEKQRDEEEDAPVLFSLTPQSAEKRPSGNDSHQQQHLANASSSSNDRSFLKSKSGSQPLSGSSKSWGCFSRSRKSQPSSASLSHKILFTSGDERRDLLRMKSMTSLKASAKAFGLNIPGVNEFRPPEVPESSGKPSSGETSDTTALAKGGGHTLRGRLRSVRSSLQVKRRPKMKKTLRRIKTMTNISVQFPPHSLKGKSLEELVRLGGDGSLRLPLHYAPAPLRLPAGIAACCVFLTRYGLRTPGLFQEMGDEGIVAEIYSYFAGQVLEPGADSKNDQVAEARKIKLPLESMRRAQTRGGAFVHDVCAVFRHFLYAIRGGIFGSPPLYEVLSNINKHAFTAGNVPKDPGRDEYLGDTPTPSAAKVRLVALALVTLADHLHLELICAVFGLLAMVVDECHMRQQLHAHFHGGSGKSCGQHEGLPNMRIASQMIGPLLIETSTSSESAEHGQVHDDASSSEKSELVNEKVDVAAMLIGAWKDICLQLQTWDIFGL